MPAEVGTEMEDKEEGEGMGREEPERGSEVGIRDGEGMGRDTLELH